MRRVATRSAGARLEGSEVARFALGVVASALLVALTTTALLAVLPSLLPGWRTTAVSSGSMVPAFEVGDAVVLKEAEPADGLLGPPTVVLVEREGLEPLLHRVLDTDGRTYRTKGDANPQPDTDRVDPAHVLGVGRLVVPYGGWVSLWWGRGEYLALALLVAAVALLVHLARYGWLDTYDPWRLAVERAADDDRDDDSDQSPETPPTSRTPLQGRSARLAGPVSALMVVVLVGAGTAHASTSAFVGSTRVPFQLSAAHVAPVTSLAATCPGLPLIIDSVTAGPGDPAPAYPPTTQAGDTLLLNRAGTRTATNGVFPLPVAPAGWTTLVTNLDDTTGAYHVVYRMTAASATGTVPHSNATADMLVVVRGVQVVDSSAASSGVRPPSGSITAPSVSGAPGGLVFALWAAGRGYTAFSPPNTMGTVAKTPTYTSQISVGGHRREVTVAGATGTHTTKLTDSSSGAAVSAQGSAVSLYARATRGSDVSWTASATKEVDGYTVLRDGQEVATLVGRSTTSWVDPTPASTLTRYTVLARLKSWKSLPVSATPPTSGC